MNWKIGKLTLKLDMCFLTLALLIPFFPQYAWIGKDVYFIVILSSWIGIKAYLVRPEIKKINLFDIGILLFIVYNFLHLLFLPEIDIKFTELWVLFFYIICLYVFTWAIKDDKSSYKIISTACLVIILIGIIQASIAVLQHFEILTSKNEYFKVSGSFTSPNFLAGYLVFGVVLILGYFITKKPPKGWARILAISILTIFMVLIIKTDSRASLLALAFATLWLFSTTQTAIIIYRKSKVYHRIGGFILSIILLMGSAKILYKIDPRSIDGREVITKIAINEITKNPFFGRGLFSFTSTYNNAKSNYFNSSEKSWEEVRVANYVTSAFNDYLQTVMESGVFGLLILLGLLFTVLYRKSLTPTSRIAIAMIIAILTLALFSSPMKCPGIVLVGLFALSILIANKSSKEKLFEINFPISNELVLKILVLFSLFFLTITFHRISVRINFSNYVTKLKEGKILTKKETKKAYLLMEDNGFSDFYLGRDLFTMGFQKEGIKYMEKGVQKTMAPNLVQNLAFHHQDLLNYERAETLLRLNVGNEPFRFEPKMDLLRILKKQNKNTQVDSLSRIIIDFPVKIQSSLIDYYKTQVYENISCTDF